MTPDCNLNDWPPMRADIVRLLHECAGRLGHDAEQIRFLCGEALRPVEPEAVREQFVEECLSLYYAS
jgi:hypothetical protein